MPSNNQYNNETLRKKIDANLNEFFFNFCLNELKLTDEASDIPTLFSFENKYAEKKDKDFFWTEKTFLLLTDTLQENHLKYLLEIVNTYQKLDVLQKKHSVQPVINNYFLDSLFNDIKKTCSDNTKILFYQKIKLDGIEQFLSEKINLSDFLKCYLDKNLNEKQIIKKQKI